MELINQISLISNAKMINRGQMWRNNGEARVASRLNKNNIVLRYQL